MRIQFSPPDITQKEIDYVVEVLKSGWITTGPNTSLFESKIAEYCGTKTAVCLNSATAAMEMVLRLLGVGPGDEVITSAYTYTASASVIEHVGAKIVLADCQKDSFLIDYDDVEKKITEKTKVIIPVDIAGVIADSERMIKIAEKHKDKFRPTNEIQKDFGRIIVMADAAHSFGSEKDGRRSGSIADFTCFSFHAVKNLTTGEGGAVTWRERDFLKKNHEELMLLALHGQNKDALAKTKPGAWEYDIIYTGYKANMTDIMAAIGLGQLERYEGLLARRRQICEEYKRRLKEIPSAEYFDPEVSSGRNNCHLALVNLKGRSVEFRNKVIEEMALAGIATNVHYKPIPMMTAYKNLGFDIKDYPNAYSRYENEITLPLHTLLSDDDVTFVMDNLIKIVKRLDESEL